MFKKKKNCNKQNGKAGKRLPLATVPSFNLTEEIRIPTLQSNELKNLVKSIELKRAAAPIIKKPISRKSTCKSVKQNSNSRPPELRTIMQTFKQLKLLHENSRSKSKSPASCNSRSTKKYFLKKKSSTALLTNPNSEVNLTLKLERTIKELNEQNFFRDEDSLLPLRSNSDAVSIQNRSPIISDRTVNLEDVDLNELRSFCIKEKGKKNPIELSLKNYSSFKENRAALKIQRAWKKYLTKRLVEHYAYLYSQHENYLSEEVMIALESNEEEGGQELAEGEMEQINEIMVESEEFYPSSIDRSKVRHISNLEEEKSVSSDYEQIVKKMKLEELEKWNQIISIISSNKSDNPLELEILLQKLTQQSEINKKDLQIKANNILSRSGSKKPVKSEEQVEPQPIHQRHYNKENSSSDLSLGLEEYDSKKYIDYLDSDIFPPERTEVELIKKGTISKKKQELLLDELKNTNLPLKLGDSALYRSESMKSIEMLHKRQKSKSSSKSHHKRSISEKVLRNTLEIMTESLEEVSNSSEINIDLLTKQFLEGSDPSADNFDMVYSQEKLKSKLAELNRMKEQANIGQGSPLEEDEPESDFAEEMAQLRRSKPSFILHQTSVQSEIKIEEGTPEKLQVQFVQAEILSESEEDEIEELRKEKGDTCATIILNTLLHEVLKDIAKSTRLKGSFQAYSLSLRPQAVQKIEGARKKGFPTGKGQIVAFLQSLVKYLEANEPQVFKNLEVSTGPTALEMLRYMHQLSEEELEDQDEQQDEANVMVVPNRVFDNFWRLKERSIVIETHQNFEAANPLVFQHHFQLLKSFNKIFYRSLFDTFNQCLDCERNFGQYGRPFPWKRCPTFQHSKSEELLRESVQKASKKMLELSTTYCGLIIEKEELGNSITEEYVVQVHEDRLSRMLASDLLEGQERWIFYDDQETEILVEISNALYTQLLIEMVEELYGKL